MHLCLVLAALSGLAGVCLGAFGAHALRDLLTLSDLSVFETASRYLLIHSALVAAVAVAAPKRVVYRVCCWVFLVGTWVFSGSLYLLVALDLPMLGVVTPVGGMGIALGWLILTVAGWREARHT